MKIVDQREDGGRMRIDLLRDLIASLEDLYASLAVMEQERVGA